MKLEEVEAVAKLVLENRGTHKSQLMVPGTEGMQIFILLYDGEIEKNILREKMRAVVHNSDCDHYFFITEAWIRTSSLEHPTMPFIRPSQLKKKGEALIVCEYRKDLTGKQITMTFERKGKKIIWLKRDVSSVNEAPSLWNFFLEKQGVSENLDHFENRVNEAFLKNLSKEYSAKYWPKIQACKTDDEREKVFWEMMDEIKAKKKEIENLKL
jgi:hypothetical protein